MSDEQLDTILNFLINMTRRQRIILNLLHKIEEDNIPEFVKDLKAMKEELGTNYFDYYIKKWEEKLK